MKAVTKLLGFDGQQMQDNTAILPGELSRWCEHPQLMFKPKGLIIWGATDQTFVESIQCGNMVEASVNAAKIPARYFEVGKSFEEIQKLAELGELEMSLPDRQKLDMNIMVPGTVMTVHLRGPFKNFCVWGIAPDSYGPMPQRVTIIHNKDNGQFVGTVSQFSLDGPEELLTVEAPTAEACAMVIAARATRRAY
jgi:hypothetical protein